MRGPGSGGHGGAKRLPETGFQTPGVETGANWRPFLTAGGQEKARPATGRGGTQRARHFRARPRKGRGEAAC